MARAGALLAAVLLLLTGAAVAAAGTIPVPSGLACPAQIASTDSPYNLLTGFVQTATDDGSFGSTGCRYVAADGHALGELAISWAHGKGVTFSGTCAAAKDTTSTSVIGNNGSTASAKAQVSGTFSEGSLPGLQPFLTATKTLVTAAESLANPCTAAKTTTTKATTTASATIRSTVEARAFLGLGDASRSTQGYVYDTVAACTGLVLRAAGYKGIHAGGVIPGETASGQHSNSLLTSGSDFHDLMDAIIPTSKITGDNVFVAATRSYVPLLRQKILEVKTAGSLEPADVLEMALDITHGNYPLAVLTAHNMLKDVAFTGRDIVAKGSNPTSFAKNGTTLLDQLRPQAQIASRLDDLRQDPAASADKLGPWYHAFAILSIGAIWNPYVGGAGAAFREHVLKKLGFFGPSEAAFNAEKAGTDFCFAFAAAGETPAIDLATLRDEGVTAALLGHIKRDLNLLGKNVLSLEGLRSK